MEKRRITQMQQSGIDVNLAFKEFLSEKISQNCRQPTIDNYSIMCGKFIESLQGKQTTDMIDKSDYDHFLDLLRQDTRKGEVSVQSYCRSVRVFLYFLQDNGLCGEFHIKLPRTQQTVKHLYTDEELTALLRKPSDDCFESEYMCWVIVNLVLATGLRLNSIINLKVSDIEGNALAVIMTKSNRPLLLTLNPECEKVLKRYIKLFRLKNTDYLFCTSDGNQYSPDTIKRYIHRYILSRGVNKTSLHLLRHSFASRFYMSTHDIYALSRILGHSEIGTTQRYLRGLGMMDIGQKMESFSIAATLGDAPKKRRGRMKKGRD